MAPKSPTPIRGIICLCHGYMDNTSFLKRLEYQRFVKAGFAVAMIEYEGHGRSDGTNALIGCWDTLVNDVHAYFEHVTHPETGNAKLRGKTKFVMGESMGGAVAYDLMSRHPTSYSGGVIFVCPMCKIVSVPPRWVVQLLYAIIGAPGTVNSISIMPMAPQKGNLGELSFKVKEKMWLATSAVSSFGRKPRLATARELLVRCYIRCIAVYLIGIDCAG